jgi:lysophospholipid acyltransferase (LPLAT)-like uncharacterized protein
MRVMGERFGVTMRPIHAHGPDRLADVAAWLRNPAPFFIAIDGGGPYGFVSTGIVRLAARLRGSLWPIALRARRAVHIPGLIAEMPLPSTTVALAIGAPLSIARDVPMADTAEKLRASLDAATAEAQRAVQKHGETGTHT